MTAQSIASILIMLGAGGHALVLLSLAREAGHQLIGVCDPQLASRGIPTWQGLPVLGADDSLQNHSPDAVALINGLGQMPNSTTRHRIFIEMKALGFTFPPLVHPEAWVAREAVLQEGAQIMAGAIIQPNTVIGKNAIINTKASIDHDCNIGDHVHIAPGATICGGVAVGEHSFIGSGCTIIQGIRLANNCLLAAGTTLNRDLGPSQRYPDTDRRINIR